MFSSDVMHEVIFVVNGVEIGVLHSKFNVDELASIFGREERADIHIFEDESEEDK